MTSNKDSALSKEGQTQALADFLPNGRFWEGKNNVNANFRKFLAGVAGELLRVEQKNQEISDEHDIRQTVNLIENWERTVGIPNDAIPIADTIEERRNNVLLMILANGTQTVDDFQNLANLLGFTIVVRPDPGATQDARYTILINIVGVTTTSSWPWTWPITWGADPTAGMRSLFEKLKPANCRIIFDWS